MEVESERGGLGMRLAEEQPAPWGEKATRLVVEGVAPVKLKEGEVNADIVVGVIAVMVVFVAAGGFT